MKAAENAAAVGDGNSKIGDVANGAGTKADDASVKGIAEGIKGIVDAAGNGDHAGAAAGDAKNPIAAAIGQAGQDGAAFNNNMKKDDKIAAAIVLRGLAKDGKFAADSADGAKSAKDGKKGDAVTSVVQEVNKWLEEMMKAAEKAAAAGDGNSKIGDVAHGAGTGGNDASVKGIAEGIKGIVDAAGKASGEKDGGALKGVKEATDKNNADAGKLFDTSAGGRQAGAADVGKASDAVSAVSGKQIIKAIVDAAGNGGHAGAAAGDATNPIAAAIGQANQAGAAFVDNNMKKDDKIAAAIVLRGLAKDEKFAATDENGAKSAKSVIESARKLTNG